MSHNANSFPSVATDSSVVRDDLSPQPVSTGSYKLISVFNGVGHFAKDPDQPIIDSYKTKIFDFLAATDKDAADSVIKWIESSADPKTTEAFAEKLYNIIEFSHGTLENNPDLQTKVSDVIREMYDSARDPKGIGYNYQDDDARIVEFNSKMDVFFFSSYIQNKDYKDNILTFLQNEYKDNGIDLWKRANPQTLVNFRDRFESKLVELSDKQVQRIINTSVQSIRNMGEIMQMRDIGVEKVEIFEAMEMRSCPLCREMHGRVVEIKYLDESLNKIVKMDPKAYMNHLKEKTKYFTDGGLPKLNAIRSTKFSEIASLGYGIPPYHPNCKGRCIKHREVMSDFMGYKVDISNQGKNLEFVDLKSGVIYDHIVKYNVVDNYGQNVTVSEYGFKHAKKHPIIDRIPTIIRNGSYYPSKLDSNKWAYIDDQNRVCVVRSDGNVILATCYKPTNIKTFKRDF